MFFYGLLAAVLSLFYWFIMSRYRYGWHQLDTWQIPAGFEAQTLVSVLVPARNESRHILTCVESILRQNYPTHLFELIVIDDHSTDQTHKLVEDLAHSQIRLLKLSDFIREDHSNSFKKKAIELGINQARGQLIVTTDADCTVPNNWLALLVSFYQSKSLKFIAAPVNFQRESSILERFQSLDFLGMMGITGAGIQLRMMNMCNGANLAYEKSVFFEVEGFSGIDHLASGDDMMLMQKVAQKYPNQLGFLKNREATVLTEAKSSWRSFIDQRLRWASKSTSYQEWKVTGILAMVFVFCLSLVSSLLLSLVWGPVMMIVFVVQLAVKAVADYLLLRDMTRFFNRKDLMNYFWPSLILHLLYIIAIGFLSNFIRQYQWKGRKVS